MTTLGTPERIMAIGSLLKPGETATILLGQVTLDDHADREIMRGNTEVIPNWEDKE